jgi:hypothetical protein
LKTFRARVKSSGSRTFSAVSTVGAPSLKSSVPMRVPTLSGVVIDEGTAVPTSADACDRHVPRIQSKIPTANYRGCYACEQGSSFRFLSTRRHAIACLLGSGRGQRSVRKDLRNLRPRCCRDHPKSCRLTGRRCSHRVEVTRSEIVARIFMLSLRNQRLRYVHAYRCCVIDKDPDR